MCLLGQAMTAPPFRMVDTSILQSVPAYRKLDQLVVMYSLCLLSDGQGDAEYPWPALPAKQSSLSVVDLQFCVTFRRRKSLEETHGTDVAQAH